jgi:hypothetical protein
MWNIISLLKSENIIKRLVVEINKDTILNAEEDPIQPIMDVIHGSIMKYDLETTRIGLKTVTDQVLKIISRADEEKISKHFCDHLTRVGRLAISREDWESTVVVFRRFESFGSSVTKKKLENATDLAIMYLRIVETEATEKGIHEATDQAALSLGNLGKMAAEKNWDKVAFRAALSLGGVGGAAAAKRNGIASERAAESLGAIGKVAVEKDLRLALGQVILSLKCVGEAAVETGVVLRGTIPEVASSFEAISMGAMEQGFKNIVMIVIRHLEAIGKAIVKKKKEIKGQTQYIGKSLEAIGEAAAGKKFDDETLDAAKSLAELTILNEENIKITIQEHESKLKEKERESFQKFMRTKAGRTADISQLLAVLENVISMFSLFFIRNWLYTRLR